MRNMEQIIKDINSEIDLINDMYICSLDKYDLEFMHMDATDDWSTELTDIGYGIVRAYKHLKDNPNNKVMQKHICDYLTSAIQWIQEHGECANTLSKLKSELMEKFKEFNV